MHLFNVRNLIMQRLALGELNKRYKVKNIIKVLVNEFDMSNTEIECLRITQDFLTKYAVERYIEDGCIEVVYNKRELKHIVIDEEWIRTEPWEGFLPRYVCFDCDEEIAFACVLKYMNSIRAEITDIKMGLKDMVNQLCRNEVRYKQVQ